MLLLYLCWAGMHVCCCHRLRVHMVFSSEALPSTLLLLPLPLHLLDPCMKLLICVATHKQVGCFLTCIVSSPCCSSLLSCRPALLCLGLRLGSWPLPVELLLLALLPGCSLLLRNGHIPGFIDLPACLNTHTHVTSQWYAPPANCITPALHLPHRRLWQLLQHC